MSRIHYLLALPLAACALFGAGLGQEQGSKMIKGWGAVVDPDGDCQVRDPGHARPSRCRKRTTT